MGWYSICTVTATTKPIFVFSKKDLVTIEKKICIDSISTVPDTDGRQLVFEAVIKYGGRTAMKNMCYVVRALLGDNNLTELKGEIQGEDGYAEMNMGLDEDEHYIHWKFDGSMKVPALYLNPIDPPCFRDRPLRSHQTRAKPKQHDSSDEPEEEPDSSDEPEEEPDSSDEPEEEHENEMPVATTEQLERRHLELMKEEQKRLAQSEAEDTDENPAEMHAKLTNDPGMAFARNLFGLPPSGQQPDQQPDLPPAQPPSPATTLRNRRTSKAIINSIGSPSSAERALLDNAPTPTTVTLALLALAGTVAFSIVVYYFI